MPENDPNGGLICSQAVPSHTHATVTGPAPANIESSPNSAASTVSSNPSANLTVIWPGAPPSAEPIESI